MGERVMIVGGGSMGAGIAAVASQQYAVSLVEPDASVRRRAEQRAPGVTVCAEMTPDDDVVLAIEAVPERLELKRAVFAAMAKHYPRAVLATNTSSLSVAEIGAVSAPERTVGVHFFNPPEKMKLVEIVNTPASDAHAVDAARAFAERIGKTAILTADTPGFVVNRVARPFYLQALRALEAGVASAEALDALARGAGFRMGPFELMDFIGLDVNLATTESLYARTGAARFRPAETQRALVARGMLGRKTGAGFYAYGDGAHALPSEMSAPLSDGVRVAVIGDGRIARELSLALGDRCTSLGDAPALVVIAGDDESDASEEIVARDAALSPACVLLADAYVTDLKRCRERMRVPSRLVGYGIIGSLADQQTIEIAVHDATGEASIVAARALFATVERASVVVKSVPGLFLGRTIGGIINEARTVVDEGVANAADVDLAMRLGTNYPRGPFAWAEEIGPGRVARLLTDQCR
jgi:3-hydroxybutyryl-CoA dehydrogenase